MTSILGFFLYHNTGIYQANTVRLSFRKSYFPIYWLKQLCCATTDLKIQVYFDTVISYALDRKYLRLSSCGVYLWSNCLRVTALLTAYLLMAPPQVSENWTSQQSCQIQAVQQLSALSFCRAWNTAANSMGTLGKEQLDSNLFSLKTQKMSSQLNYLLSHVYNCLVQTFLFSFQWHFLAWGQQCINISYYVVPELALILLAWFQG